MDARIWGGPRCGRFLGMVLLVCLCLVKQHFHYVTAEGYPELLENQGLSDNDADSRNKVDSLSHLLPFSSEQDTEYKRSSSFFPLRGKKMSLDPADIDAHYRFLLEQENAEDKRSQFYPLRGKKVPDDLKRASYFMPMRGRKDDETWNEGDSKEEDNFDKRMSSFMPMRGKKRMADAFQHLGKPGTYPTEIINPSSSGSNAGQRVSQAILPVRGEKSSGDGSNPNVEDGNTEGKKENITTPSTNHSRDKRAASFMPMRGRRTLSGTATLFSPGEIATSLLEKKHYSFMPMRGRRFAEGQENGSFINAPSDESVEDKSTSSDSRNPIEDGFTRTNMPLSLLLGEIENDYKRASSFMPMRGRRSIFQDVYHRSDLSGETVASPEDKRASSFMPMRGRRNLVDQLPNFTGVDVDQSKRASSFMPMRGRRSEDDQTEFLSNPQYRYTPFSHVPVGRTENSDHAENTDKKSFSFMPMRGRRENLTEEVDNLKISGTDDKRGSYFMPMRGRRGTFDLGDSSYFHNPYPYLLPSGIGSALMTRHYSGRMYPITNVRSASTKSRKFDWDSVKRAFHATRGKRDDQNPFNGLSSDLKNVPFEQESSEENEPNNDQMKSCRCKRSILRQRVSMKPQRQYIALKRPMSFFATRGKRLDDSSIDTVSKLH